MNDIKNHVVSENLAKELKKAGFPQNNHFGWIAGCVMAFPETMIWECAAPLASEIGERLPAWIYSAKNNFGGGGAYYCSCVDGHVHKPPGFNKLFEADTEANARAKMWLYIKREGLL